MIVKIRKHFLQAAKSCAVAFSIYSVIPMPHFDWASEDMEYHLIFFPWVGAMIGAAEWLWMWIAQKTGVNVAAKALVGCAVPVLLTGGFHLDGYLDTMDAIHSYRSRQEKLSIMDDPHIGAFAAVWGGVWFLLFTTGVSGLAFGRFSASWCLSFFLVRAFSGLGVVTIPSAKKRGMLQTFADTANRDTVCRVLAAEAVICSFVMGAAGGPGAIAMVAAGALCFVLYRRWAMRTFGGITGDLAGFFVCVTELVITLIAGIIMLAAG